MGYGAGMNPDVAVGWQEEEVVVGVGFVNSL